MPYMCLATTISASIMATGHTKPCKCGLKITLSILDDVYYMQGPYYTQQPHTSALSLVKRGDPKYNAHTYTVLKVWKVQGNLLYIHCSLA